jgi:VRR-NUC domain
LGNNLIPSILKSCHTLPLAGLLLSRRTRGKVFDRLLIDIRHLHQTQLKASADETKRQASIIFRQQMQDFCVFHLRQGARLSTLGFSTLRELTQRLKMPFCTVLGNAQVVEAATLGLRVQKEISLIETSTTTPSRKTNEWEPVVDTSVANSLTDASAARGTRTSFVSNEDNDSEGRDVSQNRSMNVEEYAKELYATGRIPVSGDHDECFGGWEGWADDEGRVLRTLFRIICGAPIFGADYGCHRMATDPMLPSVFLTPYQQAPFDLHVAYQKFEDRANAFSKLDSRRSSFYQRRFSLIVSLREKLSSLNGQELCDAVFDSVTSRLYYMHQVGRKDPVLDRDLSQIRTLSAVAAGYGGVQLAAAFTCLFFDYRTYAAGLPDLQLFRTIQRDHATAAIKVIDASWIGEQFSAQYREAANAKQLQEQFFGDDDEYLGCSKDLSGRFLRKASSGKGGALSRKCTVPSPRDIPSRLQLQYNGAKVQVQCMSVEVKSANDVLSTRQVDWLNVLDQNGYSARVCKFHASAAAKAAAAAGKLAAKRDGGVETQQQSSSLGTP